MLEQELHDVTLVDKDSDVSDIIMEVTVMVELFVSHYETTVKFPCWRHILDNAMQPCKGSNARGAGAGATASQDWSAGVQIYTGYDPVDNDKLIRTKVIVLHMVWSEINY